MRDDDKALAASIGQAVRQGRNTLGLTQADAADRIGISAEFYARIERGHVFPSVQTLLRMADELGLSVSAALGHAPDGSRREPDPPRLRRLMGWLREASPGSLRLVDLLVREMEGAD